MSKFDQIYHVISKSKFFTKGWGNPEALKRLLEFRPVIINRERCHPLVPQDYPVTIDKQQSYSDYDILEGHFHSPFADYVHGVVPFESETAYFQVVLPKKWRTKLKPMCLHLAGTGDHHYWRRRAVLAKPLVREAGIGSIILENPFYGLRKPETQIRSNLHNVIDIFVMGGCLALESTVLFHWCEREGYGPLGVTGISMGGHMASVAACVWPKPIALIPCLSWTTASCVFTQGVMSGAIEWDVLEDQVFSRCSYRDALRTVLWELKDDEAFEAGKHFVNHFAESLEQFDEHLQKSEAVFGNGTSDERSSNKFLTNFSLANLLPAANTIGNNIISRTLGNTGSGGDAYDDNGAANKLSASGTALSSSKRKDSYSVALQFMRGIMDEFTHLAGFSRPVDSSLIVIVVARDDGYVLRDGITDLREIWPNAEVRYVDAGHVSAFLFKQSVFRKAIADAFDRLTRKYYSHLQ